MNDGANPSSGRLGWLLAALLFGILAGGGIAWTLINRHADPAPVVIYRQMADATPARTPEDPPPSLRRRHRAVHPAEDLPDVLQTALAATPSPAPTPDLAAGLDGSTTTETPHATDDRQTVLVDGIAITRPPSSVAPTPRLPARPLYEPNSAPVDDSLILALEGIDKYVKKGYNLREDVWGGELARGKAKAISHQLYKGIDYWFGMGCATAGTTVRVRLYDSEGNPADTNYWQHEASDGSYAAAEILCQHTGTYFVVVSMEKSPAERVPWGVVYAYR